jgi:hypothetical protein
MPSTPCALRPQASPSDRIRPSTAKAPSRSNDSWGSTEAVLGSNRIVSLTPASGPPAISNQSFLKCQLPTCGEPPLTTPVIRAKWKSVSARMKLSRVTITGDAPICASPSVPMRVHCKRGEGEYEPARCCVIPSGRLDIYRTRRVSLNVEPEWRSSPTG